MKFCENFYRARFESLCGNLVQKCVALIDDVCAKSNVSSSDIEKVPGSFIKTRPNYCTKSHLTYTMGLVLWIILYDCETRFRE